MGCTAIRRRGSSKGLFGAFSVKPDVVEFNCADVNLRAKK